MKVLATKTIAIMTRSLAVFAILAGFYLSSNSIISNAYAANDTESVQASVTVPDACGMEATGTTHTDTATGGNYKTDFGGIATITVRCNDRNGYSVYAVGYSGDTAGSTDLIGASTNLTIPTGTGTSTSTSHWAMKIGASTSTFTPTILNGYNNYSLVPSTATKVVTYTSDIDFSGTSVFTTSYAVAVAPSQAADTYTGKVKYTVVHPNYSNADGSRETYNVPVTFAGQGVSSVTFTASGYPTRTVSTSGGTANLTAGVTYTATATITSGYEFVSWALNNANYGTLGSTSTNPTTFTPNANSASAVITATGQKQVITFAQAYASAGKSQDGGYYIMQDLTSDICTSVSDEQTATLKDRRDGSTYTVAKLLDGNCWMTQNLALDLTALTQAQLYGTGTNAGKLTNASNTTLGYLKSGGGTTSDQYPTAKLNNAAWTSSSQNYYSIPMMVSSGTCNDAYCVNNPSSGNWSFDATLPAKINGTTSRVQGKIGIYYNYCAASAGSYCYGNGTSQGTPSGNASEDICPYGWHLPAGDTAQGSFDYLYNTGYSANYNNFVDALSTPLSGYFYSGKAYRQGSSGNFWSSTRYSNSSMYSLYVNSSSVNPQNSNSRDSGNSVRCVRTS